MLKGILKFSHSLLQETVLEGETVVDATCGNGNDTLYLSNLVGESGQVFAFDIQEQAIAATKQALAKEGKANVTLIHDSHANVSNYLAEDVAIGGAIFNLGYLPRSDKKIVTKPESTIEAVDTLLVSLKTNGLLVLVIYHGHEGGKEEKEAILKHVTGLPQKEYNVLHYGFINQKNNPPFIIAIQKK